MWSNNNNSSSTNNNHNNNEDDENFTMLKKILHKSMEYAKYELLFTCNEATKKQVVKTSDERLHWPQAQIFKHFI